MRSASQNNQPITAAVLVSQAAVLIYLLHTSLLYAASQFTRVRLRYSLRVAVDLTLYYTISLVRTSVDDRRIHRAELLYFSMNRAYIRENRSCAALKLLIRYTGTFLVAKRQSLFNLTHVAAAQACENRPYPLLFTSYALLNYKSYHWNLDPRSPGAHLYSMLESADRLPQCTPLYSVP